MTLKNSGPDDNLRSNEIDDDIGQEDLQWRNLLDGVNQPLNAKKNPSNTRLDPLMGYTYEDLSRYAETASSNGGKLSMDNFPRTKMDDEIGMDSDAIFLEADAYLQLSRDAFHIDDPVLDGSSSYNNPYEIRLREPMRGYFEAISSVPSDSAISARKKGSTKDSSSIDDLWSMISALQQRQRNSSSAADVSQDLHREIFQNEDGFYNQSSVFLESLTNTSKATEANVERRGRFFRNRQQEAIASLNQQIDEMEAFLLKQKQQPNSKRQRCFQCHSFLSDEELRKRDAGTETSANAICRVCYMEELLTKNKRIEMERMSKRQQRARTTLQSYRKSGNLSENSKIVSTMGTSQNFPRGGNNDLRARSLLSSNLPQQASVEVVSSNSSHRQGMNPNALLAHGNDTAINALALQNAAVDRMPIAETTMMSVSIRPWVEMVDPDTNEIFYWNEETEEMCLGLRSKNMTLLATLRPNSSSPLISKGQS